MTSDSSRPQASSDVLTFDLFTWVSDEYRVPFDGCFESMSGKFLKILHGFGFGKVASLCFIQYRDREGYVPEEHIRNRRSSRRRGGIGAA